MRMQGVRSGRLLALAGVFAACGPTHAQQALRVVVGGPPGGLFDIALRIIAERMERELGAPLVIDNRPGAGNTVAMAYTRSTRPDGWNAAMVNVSAAANESIIRNRGYDLLADFEPVGMYAYPANILIVHPSLRASGVPALVETLKAKAGGANYSSGGVGSPGHLAGEMLKMRTGVPVTHVPYKGAPPAILAVVTGEVAFMFATASSALGQVKASKVHAVAVTTAERLPVLPELPTMAQAGLPDFNVSDWVGMLLPKGAPTAARDRLHAALVAAFSDPKARERLQAATFIPISTPLGPAQFGAFLRAEVDKWARVVREANIRPE